MELLEAQAPQATLVMEGSGNRRGSANGNVSLQKDFLSFSKVTVVTMQGHMPNSNNTKKTNKKNCWGF